MLHSEKSPEIKQSSIMLDTENSAIVILAEERKGGSEPGGWVSVTPNAADTIKRTIYLAKKDSIENVVKSKITMDFYRHFASSPATLIALLDVKMAEGLLTTFFEEEDDAASFAQGGSLQVAENNSKTARHNLFIEFFSSFKQKYVTKAPFLFSEKVAGYHDLGEGFVDEIKKTGRAPEVIEQGGVTIPLQGFMRIAAIAKALEDCDWLGSGGNTGYVIERTQFGDVAKAILVDEKSLTPVPLENNAKPQDIVIGAQSGIYIQYDLLTATQKEEFLATLLLLVQLTEQELMMLFDKKEYEDLFSAHLPPHYFSLLIQQIKETIAKQCSLYEKDLKLFCKNAIHEFAASGDEVGLLSLIEFGMDINQPDFNKMTPLLIAVNHDKPAIVNHLIAANADTTAKSKGGKTAMHFAVYKQDETILQELIKVNPHLITEKDKKGNTPLSLAIYYKKWVMVVMMLLPLQAIDEVTKQSLKQHIPELKNALATYQAKLNDFELVAKDSLLANILQSSPLASASRFFKEKEAAISTKIGKKMNQVINSVASSSVSKRNGLGYSKDNND